MFYILHFKFYNFYIFHILDVLHFTFFIFYLLICLDFTQSPCFILPFQRVHFSTQRLRTSLRSVHLSMVCGQYFIATTLRPRLHLHLTRVKQLKQQLWYIWHTATTMSTSPKTKDGKVEFVVIK